MADQLNMGGLSLNGSQHAPGQNGFGGQQSSYIPPHMRGQRGGGGGGPRGGFSGPPGPAPNG